MTLTNINEKWTFQSPNDHVPVSAQKRPPQVVSNSSVINATSTSTEVNAKFSSSSDSHRHSLGCQASLGTRQTHSHNGLNPGTVKPYCTVRQEDAPCLGVSETGRKVQKRTDSGSCPLGSSHSPGMDTNDPLVPHGLLDIVGGQEHALSKNAGNSSHHCNTTTRSPQLPISGRADQFYPAFDQQAISEHALRIERFWPDTTAHARAAFPAFCELYDTIKSFNRPNAVGARITLDSGLKLDEWEARLTQYHDKEICAYLRYGWLVGYSGDAPPVTVNRNHPSGNNFKDQVNDFIQTECNYGAMLGPFFQDPFSPWMRKSPVMSRPKKDTSKRRIIIDLTFPEGEGVNSAIDIHSVFGRDISYKLPSIWDLTAHLNTIGPGAWIWVADLQRAYRQLRVDPLDTPLLGQQVDEGIFLDLCPAFGCRCGLTAHL